MLGIQTQIYIDQLNSLSILEREPVDYTPQLVNIKGDPIFQIFYSEELNLIIVLTAKSNYSWGFQFFTEEQFLDFIFNKLRVQLEVEYETFEQYTVQQWIDKQLSRDAIQF